MQLRVVTITQKMNIEKNPLLIDIYEDLQEFKETRESITNLIKMRKALIDMEDHDIQRINEVETKAMTAINNLFA